MSKEQDIRARVAAATPGPLIEGTDGNVRVYGPDNTEHAGLVAVFYGSRRRGNATLFANTEADLAYLLDRVKELEDEIKALAKAADSYSFRVVMGIEELSKYTHMKPVQIELTRRSNEMQDAIEVARQALKEPA